MRARACILPVPRTCIIYMYNIRLRKCVCFHLYSRPANYWMIDQCGRTIGCRAPSLKYCSNAASNAESERVREWEREEERKRRKKKEIARRDRVFHDKKKKRVERKKKNESVTPAQRILSRKNCTAPTACWKWNKRDNFCAMTFLGRNYRVWWK